MRWARECGVRCRAATSGSQQLTIASPWARSACQSPERVKKRRGSFVEGVAACPHPGFQLSVVDRSVRGRRYFRSVDGKHGAYIGVHDQSGQGTEDKFTVIQAFVATALCMGDGDDAVKVGE